MRDSEHREGNGREQEQSVLSETRSGNGRVYYSGNGERRIGRLTQTIYGEEEPEYRGARTAGRRMQSSVLEQTARMGRNRAAAQTDSTVQNSVAEQTGRASRNRAAAQTDSTVQNSVAEQTGRVSRNRAAAQTDSTVQNSVAEQTGRTSRNRSAEHKPVRSRSPKTENREPQSIGGWKEKMHERRRKRVRRAMGAVFGVIAVVYIAVAVYFGFHFYEGTVIYGIDCSQMTVEEVKQEVGEKLDQYVLAIQERENRTETITAEQIGLKFVDNSSIDDMLRAQYSFIWPAMMLMDRAPMVSVAFEYDRQSVEDVMNQMECFDVLHAVDPRDAYISTTDTGFEVVKEVMGTTLDHDRTLEVVLAALDAGAQEVSLEENGCYIDPKVYQDDEELVSDAAAMNELAGAYITYDFGIAQEVVNAQVIQNWIVELDDGTFVIDDAYVYDYVEEMAAKYDTFGLPITFYTSLGTTETLSGGDYGWCIDQDQTVVDLLKALENGYQGTMEPAYLYTAMSHENNGIGYTYVEICISQQRMWCYENGTCIVDTPVVTGNPNKGNGTPSGGVWAIDAKKRDAILEGEGYTAPVDYWMPFNGDIGIHDLKSRAYFGSTIYLTNGSHGCVNTPYDAVQTIYNTVSIGTPVIVYE